MRSEPYKQYKSPFVVFGCGDKATKGVVAGKFRGIWGLKILELADGAKYERGDKLDVKDIAGAGEHFTIYFAKKESIDWFIRDLEALRVMMENDNHERK